MHIISIFKYVGRLITRSTKEQTPVKCSRRTLSLYEVFTIHEYVRTPHKNARQEKIATL